MKILDYQDILFVPKKRTKKEQENLNNIYKKMFELYMKMDINIIVNGKKLKEFI